jgi:CheY-like chemotaxis protein
LTYGNGQVTFAISPLIRGISLARKILLADDSVTAQNMGRKILADAGYEVIAVNNGSAALKKILELKPDLVILDVYMPGYSGLEVCQRLKESQETARIPVLLTVGKLEPFKPEEAQRVRAEGFIVKPFEASELLSTMSKLEDKVVPRAEPSKPGRFARAIAAAEESSRGSRNESAGEDNGWKSRIGFPKKKTEPEEKVADEAPVDRRVKRNRRTEDKPAVERAVQQEEKHQPAGGAAEASVDVAALAPAALPKDVTPAEVAAIAAAAARIQMVGAAINGEHRVSEHKLSEARVSETTSQASLAPPSDKVEDSRPSPLDVQGDSAAPVNGEAKTEALLESKEESKIDGLTAAEADHRRNGDETSEEAHDVPVTMAATAESVVAASAGRSRWTAVSVALQGEEASISLDQEMQKAHSAFAAAAGSTSASTVPELQAGAAENSSALADTAVPIAAISNPEPGPVSEPEHAVSAAATEAGPAPVAQSDAAAVASSSVAAGFGAAEPASLPEPASASSQQPEVAAAPATAEAEPTDAHAETSCSAKFAEQHQESVPVAESVIPVVETEVAASGAPEAQELQPAPEAAPAMAEAGAASSSAFAPIVRDEEHAPEPKEDSDAVRSTAAAWASWRQIRDTSKASEVAEASSKEFDAPRSAPAEIAARAVAAGAEQIVQEASAAATSGDASNVASIVESVLADLRPKLMEEISRKMSEKK